MGQYPRLYNDLAEWWHLLSEPADYAEEAGIFHDAFCQFGHPKTMLELGSGGGNNAFHLKKHYQMTLIDLSPKMLKQSQYINPNLEHIPGDMRTIRLDRTFDAVFIHDAIMYMRNEKDLRAALETAFVHCRPGGLALFVPDEVRENFLPGTSYGGHDDSDSQRGLRYLEWTWDPDPNDTTITVEFSYLIRHENGLVCNEYDRHILGLFPYETWRRLIQSVGFDWHAIPYNHSEFEPSRHEFFVGLKPE